MTPRSFVNIAAMADAVLSKSGSPRLPNGIAVDVESILRNYFKFDVAEIPRLSLGGKRLSGAYAPEQRLVMVEADEPATRKRFSLAHELGHAEVDFRSFASESLFAYTAPTFFRCQYADVADLQPGANLPNRSEVLANKFAAHLLMPSGLVRELWRKQPNEDICAKSLAVSREALHYRLEALGLILVH